MDGDPDWLFDVWHATRRRRAFAALLLGRCTPTWDGATLQLRFSHPADAYAWADSGSGAALDAALQHCGIQANVTVTTA